MHSKDFHSDWTEWILIEKENRFRKEWRSFVFHKEKKKFVRVLGEGKYKQEGPWILFETESVRKYECNEEEVSHPSRWKQRSYLPCPSETSVSISVNIPHKLLYHFDSEERSIAPLQYESGYLESGFGIGWESGKPYEEGILFKKAKSKYVKKEFQPHVYYYGRLD
ncbi:hypothetical protein [Leptospira idonii]|uniref:Uncharacterized protein n=1 Tax=Leptospira idonii TaxID=1193500 RepID=A0A4R9M2J4_9LEPT|nr:hypothetical protein [Leptospira idonii]TGN19947.1 hypothetical protein EHS15_06100 [Leptospira idonii]